jgi:hypothetical protein
VRAAVHMWPGSEAHILGVEPTFLDVFNGAEALESKVARILELLDMPGEEAAVGAEAVAGAGKADDRRDAAPQKLRPQLIAAYVPDVDGDGHSYGPNSTEITTTIRHADRMLDDLFRGLAARNLTDIVNVVVVSDHGMATTDVTRLVQLEDLVDTALVDRIDGWPLYGLRLKDDSAAHLESVHASLLAKTKENPNLEVYLRDKDMPPRYHFSRSDRIAPLWIVPKTGWAVVTRDEMVVADALKEGSGAVYHPRGLHGYDHEHPLMRAIFVARGPAFPHAPGSELEPFREWGRYISGGSPGKDAFADAEGPENTNVYNILCDSLGLAPAPNNGTLRLPLRPVGVHSPDNVLDVPQDPVPAYTKTEAAAESESTAVAGNGKESSAALKTAETAQAAQTTGTAGHAPVSVDPAPTAASTGAAAEKKPSKEKPDDQVDDDDDDDDDEHKDGGIESMVKGWWDWLTDKTEELWDSVTGG